MKLKEKGRHQMCEDLVTKKTTKKSLVTQTLETISNLETERKVLKI